MALEAAPIQHHREKSPEVRGHGGACCVRTLAVTILAIGLIGAVAGGFAYLLAAGYCTTTIPWLHGLGTIGVANSYVVMGGGLAVFAMAVVGLIAHCQHSRCGS